MNANTDQHYIQKTLDGDTRAFSVLVARYQSYVFTTVLRMVKVREVAEEVAQDSFIKAFQSLKTYRGEAKFSTWLYSIAYRKALDALRKNKRERTSEFIDEISEGNFEDIENALGYLEAKERTETIQQCIMALPEEEAAIITLYYFEEQSVREIAQITAYSEDNIKIKLYRSRKKLFTLLKNFIMPEITDSNGKAI
ncbi:RNA polymerase sigma factor [Constantimarinum furrinae]|nr:RNA polymerase sigma factor [Constantimarinum furrinae]